MSLRQLPYAIQTMSSSLRKSTSENTLKSNIILKIAVSSSNIEVVSLYKNHIEKHNKMVHLDPFANSGFDLFVPTETLVKNDTLLTMIPMDVKCEMIDDNVTTGYFMFPRSSISKTPLMLANHTGVIDSGYRGILMGAFRNLLIEKDAHYTVEKHSRLLQICHPGLKPFYVSLVEESDLSSTDRGDGGFGSTGK